MKRHLVAAMIGVSLGACAVAATSSNASHAAGASADLGREHQASSASVSRNAMQADEWAGVYSARTDGGGGDLTVRSRGDGSYNVAIDVGGPGCGGAAEGIGRASGNRMIWRVPVPDHLAGDPGYGDCLITLTRNGNRLTMTEGDQCLLHHGAACNFTGTATLRGGRPATPRSARASARPQSGSLWLVGAWVQRGEACGGEGWVIHANGEYVDLTGSGVWSASGTVLTLTMQMEAGEDLGEGRAVRNPRPARLQITSVTPRHDRFSVRYQNGAIGHFVRCR